MSAYIERSFAGSLIELITVKSKSRSISANKDARSKRIEPTRLIQESNRLIASRTPTQSGPLNSRASS